MKTFIFSLPARLRSFNEMLDVKGALCGKSWEVFNDEGVKQLFIFNTDGTLLITINGKVLMSSWQYIPANASVIITAENETTMFHPAFYDKTIFALQQDGVERYLFMIDEQKDYLFPQMTLKALNEFFDNEERKVIEAEHQAWLQADAEQKKKKEDEEKAQKEKERQREWEQQQREWEQQQREKEEKEKKEREEELERKRNEEREELREYLLDNKDRLFNDFRKKRVKGWIISCALFIVGLAVVILSTRKEFSIQDELLSVLILSIGIVLMIGACIGLPVIVGKTDYVKERFAKEKGKDIKLLDEREIKQLYEEL